MGKQADEEPSRGGWGLPPRSDRTRYHALPVQPVIVPSNPIRAGPWGRGTTPMRHPSRSCSLLATALLLFLPRAIRAEEAKPPEPILLWPAGAPGESRDADREER